MKREVNEKAKNLGGITIGEERYWKNDTNHEHFVVADYENGTYKIEYLTNGRVHEKTKNELEEGTLLSDFDSFAHMDCEEASKFQTGKIWLYANRCRTCIQRLGRCAFV